MGLLQGFSAPSSATASRSSSSFASKPRANLIDRSSAQMRSFKVRLALYSDALCVKAELLSSENEELQAVLSVHSVPHRDSRSSLAQTLGLQSPLPVLCFDFISAVWTACKAPSMALNVLAASALDLVRTLGLGMREPSCISRMERRFGEHGGDWAPLAMAAGTGRLVDGTLCLLCTWVSLCTRDGGSGEAPRAPGERRREKDVPVGEQTVRIISSRLLPWLG